MSKIIPFFTAQSINTVSDYNRFYHTKRYIASKTVPTDTTFKLSPTTKAAIKKMAVTLGFSNIDKFLKLKHQWDLLQRDIPVSYFDYIGIRADVLEYTLELDNEDYCQTLALPRYPKSAVPVRDGHGIGVSSLG